MLKKEQFINIQSVLSILVLMAIIVVSCNGSSEQTPGERALKAVKLVLDNKVDKLDDFILHEDITDKAMFFGMLATSFAKKGGVTRFEIESEKITYEWAEVKIRWYYKNGESAFEIIPMIMENERWKIDL